MPALTVFREVLLDTTVAGEVFSVVRRTEVVNGFGESVLTPQTLNGVVGSVQPTGDNSLVREDAYQTQAKTISVVTMFRLRGEAQLAGEFQPDLVLWKGGSYLVRTVEDYTQYGEGAVRAECTSVDYVDAPPA